MTGNLQADGVQSRQTLFVRYCLIKRLSHAKNHVTAFFAYELTLAVSLDSMAKKNADCDCDGEVGSNDAVSLMRFLVHLISTLPEPDLS